MKYKLILFLALILSSCGYAPMDNSKPVIITEIVQGKDNYCYYYGKGNQYSVLTICDWNFEFKDTCGKFQIGDTINFVK